MKRWEHEQVLRTWFSGPRGHLDNYIYLSGPMTGIEDYNFPLFNDVARKLRVAGNMVYNPAETSERIKGSEHWARADLTVVDAVRHQFMRVDLPAVAAADTVVLLPDWQDSRGARAEAFVGWECGVELREWPTLRRIYLDNVSELMSE